MPPRCQLLSGSLPRPTKFPRNPSPILRTFATTTPLCGPKGGDLGAHLPVDVIPRDARIPEYPYGPALLYKQSNKGLYGGQRIQFGNNVSPDTETKTRRNWKPNIMVKSLYSITLKKKIKLRVSSKVLKTMDREGGLDEYLLKESETRIKELGPLGWALRWTLMQQPEVIARFRAEAAALGLAQDVIDKQWPENSPARLETKERKEARLASEAQEEQAKLTRRDRLAKQRLSNWQKEQALQNWAQKYRKQRVAPDMNFARAMAKDERSRIVREIRYAGGERIWKAWQRAKARGEVETAGGDDAWLSQNLAAEMMKENQKKATKEGRQLQLEEQRRAQPVDKWEHVVEAKRR